MEDRNSCRIGTVILIGIVGLIALAGCATKDQTESTAVSEPVIIVHVIQDSTTVFDFTVAHHQVEFNRSSMGVFVTTIDSVGGDGAGYWTYSVNGEPGQVAADRAALGPGDTLRWRYGK